MRPVSRRDAGARNPVDRTTARRAVKDEPTEFSFEVGLHVQQLKAKHLRLERDGMRAVEASVVGFVHDGARVLRLLGNGSDGTFQMSRSRRTTRGC